MIPRLETFQQLISTYGCPGSSSTDWTPCDGSDKTNLHPLLLPLLSSSQDGERVISAVVTPYTTSKTPLPIVESFRGSRGLNLLSLNSEHLLRRIAATKDTEGVASAVNDYNANLGSGLLPPELDNTYLAGDVDKLGYGVDKYLSLRVGPFPDVYYNLALSHKETTTRLIAAEAANGKFGGWGGSFRRYGRLLEMTGDRADEARDAVLVCFNLPLYTVGMDDADFLEIARIAGIDGGFQGLRGFVDKLREKENSDMMKGSQNSKSPQDAVLEKAGKLLDETSLSDEFTWDSVRGELGALYREAGKNEVASFVEC